MNTVRHIDGCECLTCRKERAIDLALEAGDTLYRNLRLIRAAEKTGCRVLRFPIERTRARGEP